MLVRRHARPVAHCASAVHVLAVHSTEMKHTAPPPPWTQPASLAQHSPLPQTPHTVPDAPEQVGRVAVVTVVLVVAVVVVIVVDEVVVSQVRTSVSQVPQARQHARYARACPPSGVHSSRSDAH